MPGTLSPPPTGKLHGCYSRTTTPTPIPWLSRLNEPVPGTARTLTLPCWSCTNLLTPVRVRHLLSLRLWSRSRRKLRRQKTLRRLTRNPLNLEETLAAVAVIQSEIDGLAWTAYDAAWEADEALSSLQAAKDARSAIDAHEKLLDALQRADEATRQMHDVVDYWALRERVEGPYWVYAEAALAAGGMTTDEHEAALLTIQDAIGALRTNALSSGNRHPTRPTARSDSPRRNRTRAHTRRRFRDGRVQSVAQRVMPAVTLVLSTCLDLRVQP